MPGSVIGILAVVVMGAAAPSPEGLEFFEAKIRPVLVKSCFSCHSAGAKSLKAGLVLDSAAGMRKGGEGGPAVVPGNVEESLLISAIRYETSQMPPSGKLPESTIKDFTKWVEMGAPDPRSGGSDVPAVAARKGIDFAEARKFWSFRPPVWVAPGTVSDGSWARTEIDRYILSSLEARGLKPVRAAGKRELIRRATFDLTGLPPRPEEVDAFLADGRPDAFDRVIDRLLASPHYGERWARYWLDVARYAEDQAHTFGTEPNTSGYRYRDWVVRAFNGDMPYDRFIKLQIAGDLLPEGLNAPFDGRVAVGFFGLGAQYYKNTDAAKAAADELDDRVDTLTRGFLGLTVACARCHDHKFDPIPTQDYYSLAGIFQSSSLANRPLVSDEQLKRYQSDGEKLKKAEAELATVRDREKRRILEESVERIDAYLLAARDVIGKGGVGRASAIAEFVGHSGLNRDFVERWVRLLDPKDGAGRRLAALDSWKTFQSLGTTEAARAVRAEIQQISGRRVVSKSDPSVSIDLDISGARRLYLVVSDAGDGTNCDWADWIEPTLMGPGGVKKLTELTWKSATSGSGPVSVGKNAGGGPLKVGGAPVAFGIGTHAPSVIVYDLPAGYTRFRTRAGLDNGGTDQGGTSTVRFLATTRKPETFKGVLEVSGGIDAAKADLLKTLFGENGVFAITDTELLGRVSVELAARLRGLMAEVQRAKAVTREPLPIAHSLTEGTPADLRVFVRGNPAQQGDAAPRRFLRILAGDEPARFTKGSGRLELAEAVASEKNPLTARVMVNRIWQNHFGRGLVGTSSNFGTLGEPPSHPALLDYLATQLVASGWSIKAIHREILQSRTYQLSTDFDDGNFRIDGDNRLLWRANRRRLDVESWRDAFLAVSGRMDERLGGPSVSLSSTENSRRTVYAVVSRHELDSLLRLFDFPDPNITSDKRTLTTVPQQQLFVLNSPFVVQQARALVQRLTREVGPRADDAARVGRAYRLLYGREPEADEVSMGVAYLAGTDAAGESKALKVSRWERYAQVLLSGNEFLYLD